jgi:hypothetical protein
MRYETRPNVLVQLSARRVALLASLLCAPAVAPAQPFVPDEIRAIGAPNVRILDPEFEPDEGRFCWISEGDQEVSGDETLWLGRADPVTGLFDPPDGKFESADFGSIVGVRFIGNGCEWAQTASGPAIVYTKLDGGTTLKDREVAYASKASGVWQAAQLVDGDGTYAPIASTDPGDTTPGVAYQGFIDPTGPGIDRAIYLRFIDDPASEQMIPTTDELFTPGARWVPDSNSVIFTRPMNAEGTGRQVFLYDMDTEILEQVTDNATEKWSASMWQAPEYGGESIFLALEDEEYLGIYRKLDTDGDGVFTWTQTHIVDPPASGTFIWSPEPFVVDGKSYIVMTNSPSDDQQSLTIPTEIWIAGIDPVDPFYRKISDDRVAVRKDPEAVIFPGDLPRVRSVSPADFAVTESGTVAETGQTYIVGAAAQEPAGGRNVVLVFELPELIEGKTLATVDLEVHVLSSTFPTGMAADLWALDIAPTLNLSAADIFLEEDQDDTISDSLLKVADDFLTGATPEGQRAGLQASQQQALADYLMAFYDANPDYSGGSNLYLRLNPDINGGVQTRGWQLAASEHPAEAGATLTLNYATRQVVAGSSADGTITEHYREITGSNTLHVGAARTRSPAAGRNAMLAFDLPQLAEGDSVESATLSFFVAANTPVHGINGDLWALGTRPTGSRTPRAFLEADSDTVSSYVKLADDLLTDTTLAGQRLTADTAADALGAYLNDFYRTNPDYAGGETLYLRLNPDADMGSVNAGWLVYSGETPLVTQPRLLLSLSSGARVWVYVSSDSSIWRLSTGL